MSTTSVNNVAPEAIIVDADAAKKDDPKACIYVFQRGPKKYQECGMKTMRGGEEPFCFRHAPKKPPGNDVKTRLASLEAKLETQGVAQDVAQDVVHQVTDLQTKVIALEANKVTTEAAIGALESHIVQQADQHAAELEAQAAKFEADLKAYKANLKAELEADLKAKKKKSSKKKEEKVETSQPPAVAVETQRPAEAVEAKPNDGANSDSDSN
jgi:hypothetical protein